MTESAGNRLRGRQRVEWINYVKDYIRQPRVSVGDANGLVHDRAACIPFPRSNVR